MSKIVAVVHEDLAMGFRLAGVGSIACENSDQALEAIRNAIDSREFGMVIVQEELIDGIDQRLRDDMLKRTRPLIVPVPVQLTWKDTEEVSRDDLVARLIRQAVGYQLNIHF